MTRTRYTFSPGDPAPYFLTVTTVNWLPLFSNPDIASFLIESLQYLIINQRIQLFAYVIMENHLHLIAGSTCLSKDIANFKSFTARKSIDYYRNHNYQSILAQLSRENPVYQMDREYRFWQEGSHPERMKDEAMMQQKINYIHNNPVNRGYVDLPEHWRYSSARNYMGIKGLLPIMGIDDGD